jgi:MOSC domain-containing protein YiiM
MIPGARLALGDEVVIELTDFATPCKTIRESFVNQEFVRISQKLHPGESRVYARILREGVIRPDDVVQLLPADMF